MVATVSSGWTTRRRLSGAMSLTMAAIRSARFIVSVRLMPCSVASFSAASLAVGVRLIVTRVRLGRLDGVIFGERFGLAIRETAGVGCWGYCSG